MHFIRIFWGKRLFKGAKSAFLKAKMCIFFEYFGVKVHFYGLKVHFIRIFWGKRSFLWA